MSLIPLQQAKEMIQRYSTNKVLILKDNYDPLILPDSETFSRGDIDQILHQQECTSFRVYFGMSSDLNIRAILVGVDVNGNDILVEAVPVIIEEGIRCPPYCKANAGLNDE